MNKYEIIDGKKYIKCKDNQIRNPITKRCNKIKSFIPKENIFKSKEKTYMDYYEYIDGKKYIKCKDDQIRNSITKRCNKIKSFIPKENISKSKEKTFIPKENISKSKEKTFIPKENISKSKENIFIPKEYSLNTKNKAAIIIQNKFKKFIYPFINRVSSNINDRIFYYKQIIKNISIDDKYKKYCLKFIEYDNNNNPIYTIGDKIILKKKIGTNSKNGIVYLCSFKDKTKKLYKYSIKIALYKKSLKKEINILLKLKEAVLNNTCPHFPIIYGVLICDNYKNIYKKNISLYPLVIKDNIDKTFISIINELANGDVRNFIYKFYNKDIFLENALAQIYISLLFFYKNTKSFHNDVHWGNFLYHKIKPGGYFHYKIFDNDYYIENLGYLWIIWDFDRVINFTDKSPLTINTDFFRIINAFKNKNNINGGWIKNAFRVNKTFKNKILYIENKIFNNINIGNYYYDKKLFNKYIQIILDTFVNQKILLLNIDNNKLINKKPYIINEFL